MFMPFYGDIPNLIPKELIECGKNNRESSPFSTHSGKLSRNISRGFLRVGFITAGGAFLSCTDIWRNFG